MMPPAANSLHVLDGQRLALVLRRLALEVAEHHPGPEAVQIIALQPRGVHMGRRMRSIIQEALPTQTLNYGELDVTFHRDDYRHGPQPLLPTPTQIDFTVEGQKVILVDDVLYTGRTVRAALDALLAYGRPAAVELMVLIDRRFHRELPIECHYRGVTVDTLNQERVLVHWQEVHGEDAVWITTRTADA